MARKSTWTNSDGLVVGFGPNSPEYAGNVTEHDVGGAKLALTQFSWVNLNADAAINVPVPLGSRILDVRIRVITGFTSTGTNTIEVGDGTDPDGFITATAATTATMATAGLVILADGAYAFATTDTTAHESKLYATADTIDLISAQNDWTAGEAALEVTYV